MLHSFGPVALYRFGTPGVLYRFEDQGTLRLGVHGFLLVFCVCGRALSRILSRCFPFFVWMLFILIIIILRSGTFM